MSSINSGVYSTVIPCLRYRDAHAAIASLCDVFGFTERLVVPGDGDAVIHAELSYKHGMVMLASASGSAEFNRLVAPPDPSAPSAHSLYLVVPDADAVYERVQRAGMQIIIDLKDEAHGGRGFTCRDLEYHIWSVGTYEPFAR